MSRRGDCYDNAVVESFFGTVKQELVHEASWGSTVDARASIHEYIEVFYNRQRLHSSLGYRTPAEVDQAAQQRLDTSPQVMSLLPRTPSSTGAPPPDRRAALELRQAQLSAAPPKHC